MTGHPDSSRRESPPALKDDDEVIGIVGEIDPVLLVDIVDAVCVKVQKIKYPHCKDPSRVFSSFEIFSPEEYAGETVRLFCRDNPRWRYLSRRSSLYKAATVAEGRPLTRRSQVTRAMFERKAFRLRLRQSGTGANTQAVRDFLAGL